ncbi:hypothetical protein RND81_11G067300 [Saponaria officinalis]|uniref:Uncharacterized protein n=1 Tax=Saponaria officinalis TaxID=3572 RepID=A0AAW1HIS1_SAPOF
MALDIPVPLSLIPSVRNNHLRGQAISSWELLNPRSQTVPNTGPFAELCKYKSGRNIPNHRINTGVVPTITNRIMRQSRTRRHRLLSTLTISIPNLLSNGPQSVSFCHSGRPRSTSNDTSSTIRPPSRPLFNHGISQHHRLNNLRILSRNPLLLTVLPHKPKRMDPYS